MRWAMVAMVMAGHHTGQDGRSHEHYDNYSPGVIGDLKVDLQQGDAHAEAQHNIIRESTGQLGCVLVRLVLPPSLTPRAAAPPSTC